ncbi:phage head completion protein [Sphingobium limneticum]|uniref:phage head completion protein n=1 Tax=Sphingobium limneticum TaxID=1007511 RepID=UPI003CFF5EF2
MSLDSGRRDKRIVIERYEEAGRDTLNAPIYQWIVYVRASASVYYGSGSEQREAAQTSASLSASFEVLANSKTRGVLMTDRIRFDNLIWDIRSTIPLGHNAGVRITAVAVTG